MNLYVLVAIMM